MTSASRIRYDGEKTERIQFRPNDIMFGKQNDLCSINLSKSTGYVMHQQFNIQKLYALPTQYLCVLYLSEKKQRLVPLQACNGTALPYSHTKLYGLTSPTLSYSNYGGRSFFQAIYTYKISRRHIMTFSS